MTVLDWNGELAEFLRFLKAARVCYRKQKAPKNHPQVQRIRQTIEEQVLDSGNKTRTYQSFESAFYEDAQATVALMNFLEGFDSQLLKRYRTLVQMELSGLTSDYHPTAMLGRSPFGLAALLLSALTIWWGVLKLVSDVSPGVWLSELWLALLGDANVNRIVGIVWLVGMFVVSWYVLRMRRNQRQLAFLSSLARTIELRLGP